MIQHLPALHARALRPMVQKSPRSDECLYDRPVPVIARRQRPKLQQRSRLCNPHIPQQHHCTSAVTTTQLPQKIYSWSKTYPSPRWCGDHRSRCRLELQYLNRTSRARQFAAGKQPEVSTSCALARQFMFQWNFATLHKCLHLACDSGNELASALCSDLCHLCLL